MRSHRRRVGALLVVGVAAGCVSGSFDHVSLNEPIATTTLERLAPGVDTLASCLATLGAPNRVFEYHVGPDRTSGMALLWFWSDAFGWGLQVSASYREASASVDWDSLAKDLPACMLWFDEDLRLERWQTGLIGDLVPHRQRPSAFGT